MHQSRTYIRHVEERLERRLSLIGAKEIALLGAGRFASLLLASLGSDQRFAGARVVGVIDETSDDRSRRLRGFKVFSSASEIRCDAVVVATPMHESQILRRSDLSENGNAPIIGLHHIHDPQELAVDTLLLPETAWFGLDLPGILERAGKPFVIASADGLLGYDQVETAAYWAAHADTPADQLQWHSLDLFDVVKGSAACLFGRAAIDPVADRGTLIRLMDESIRVYESALHTFSGPHSPVNAVVANGLFHHQRAVAEAAMCAGKPVFAMESSCFPGLYKIEEVTQPKPSDAEAIRKRSNRTIGPSQRARITSYLSDRKPHTESRTDSDPQPAPDSAEAIRSQLRLPEGGRVLLLLGQVCTDTSLVYRAPVVDDVVRLAEIAAGVVERIGGWTLLIKPHPKEATGTDPIAGKPYQQGAYDRLVGDPLLDQSHVRLVGACEHNVYSLMALADAGVTINSQSAMEMASIFAKPVCVAGQAPYTDAGFTRNAASVNGIAAAIDQMLKDPVLTPEQHACALRYVYDEVYENLIPTEAGNAQASVRQIQRLFGKQVPVS